MKKLNVIKRMIAAVMLIFCHISWAGGLVESASKKLPETKILFKSIIEEKEEQLKQLNQEKASLEAEKETVLKSIKSDIEETKNKQIAVQRDLQKFPEDDFLTKKLTLLTETHDLLNDLMRTWENLLKKVSDHSALLEKYLKDPELKEYKKNLKISAGPYFFEDLEEVYQKMVSQQKFVDQLKKRKENAIKEIKSQTISVEKLGDEYKEKKNKQDEFGRNTDASAATIPFGLTVQQRAELLNLETGLAKLKKDLAELQLKEKKQELALVDSEIFIETLHLDLVQELQRTIKSSITVTAEQIEAANQELEKKKQSFSLLKTRYNDEITKLRRLRDEQELRLMEFSKRYSVALGNDLDTWSLQPKKTLESYLGLCEVGLLNAYVRLIDDKEMFYGTLITLEQEKINYAEEIVKIKETYYKILHQKFGSEDEITQEIKKYTDRQAANEATIKSYKTKKDEIEASIAKLQNEVLDRVKKRKTDVTSQKDTLFKGQMREYALCLTSLDKAEEYISFRISIMEAASKAYAETITTLDKVAGYSIFILTELSSITIWYRPEYAITWAGIQNIGADVRLFLVEVRSYLMQFDLGVLWSRISDMFKRPLDLLWLIVKLLLLFTFFSVLQRTSHYILVVLRTVANTYPSLRFIVLALAVCVGFTATYAWLIAGWFAALIFLKQQVMPDPYLYVLFYVLSIPYILYLAHRFIQYVMQFNESCNYCFVASDFQQRFFTVVSTLAYSTIALLFFRHAVLLVKLPKSELPTILLAINFILFQIALIFLISKDQVLNIIPGWLEWFYRWVDRYYYLMLFGIAVVIVMSNPYIGYGRLVLYLLSGLVWTTILLWLLVKGHKLVKKGVSQIFFVTQDEVVRERFSYAKTWFGIAIIISFLIFLTIGLMLGAKIWGWPLTLKDVIKWLNMPLLGIGKGTSTPLTLFTIGSLLIFILGGFVLAFAFNRFVLERVFDLMLVEPGVQHAISSLVRYLLVAASIVLGFQSVGYGGLITYLYVLILGIGYLIKEPLNDMFAYFIILMQRPIKVGDYIEIDEEIKGVVRKITPKSVMLRRNNSTTIVVPNNQIVNKSLANWNYARNYIAFNDIVICVSYKADPSKVKDILLSVLDAHPNVLKSPKPVIRLEDFRDFGFEFMVRGFISSNLTLEKWEIASDVRLAIVKVLREHEIEIAVPVRIIVSPGERFSISEGQTKEQK